MTDRRSDQLRDQLEIYSAIQAALTRWPEVSALAAEAQQPDEARQRLQAVLGVSELGANAILEMQLRRLTVLERERIARVIRELETEIAEL